MVSSLAFVVPPGAESRQLEGDLRVSEQTRTQRVESFPIFLRIPDAPLDASPYTAAIGCDPEHRTIAVQRHQQRGVMPLFDFQEERAEQN